MSDSKPSGVSNTVVSNDPWSGQAPYLSAGFSRASELLNQPVQYYPNSTVVPFHGATQEALSREESRARAGSPLLAAGQKTMQDTAEGKYIGRNPYLDDVINRATGAAGAQIDARFSQAGRYGSGHHAGALVDRSSDIAAGILAPAYESERGRQMQAAGAAPAMAAADYGDIDRLGLVGGRHEQQGQAELQDMISRYAHAQTSPRDALREYMATVGGGSFGGQSTTAQPIYSDPFGQALGYASTGAGIAGTLFGKGGVFR